MKINRILSVIIFCLSPLWVFSFENKENNQSTQCVTYFTNLTTESERKQRDICYTVKLEEYTEYNKKYRFTVTIVDNEKKRTIVLDNRYFTLRIDSGNTINYNIDESWDYGSTFQIKSLIYFKEEKKWCILFKEFDEFKYFSFYRGSQFIDDFGVGKSIKPNSQNTF